MHHKKAARTDVTRGAVATATLLASTLAGPSRALAVNWEQQAERLERVSASLLDAVPILSPPVSRFGLGVTFDVSFLPKPNPRVGSKSEKVPASPVHTVPTVKGYALFSLTKTFKLGLNAYAGYLMPGLEGIVGVKAKLSQYTAGAGTTVVHVLTPDFSGTMDLGVHMTGGTLKGAITATDAKDSFTFSTMLIYMAPGFWMPKWGVYGNMMLGYKSTTAEMKIPADNTSLKTKDTLDDAPAPVVTQFAIGWRHKSGVEAGLAYLLVPARVYMPRMHLAWIYPLGGKSQSSKAGKVTDAEAAAAMADAAANGEAASAAEDAAQAPAPEAVDGVAPAPAAEDAPVAPVKAKPKKKAKKPKASKARRGAPAGTTPAPEVAP